MDNNDNYLLVRATLKNAGNADNVSKNTGDIANNASNISQNVSDIAINKANITNNAANIQSNADNITANTANINTNAANIQTNTDNITDLQNGGYAGIYINNNTTVQSIPTGTTYTKIVNFGGNSIFKNATADYANNQIQITKQGSYKIISSASMSSGTNNVVFNIAVFKNGAKQMIELKRKVATAGDVGNASAIGLLYCNADDIIDLRVTHDNTASVDLTVEYCNFNVEYLGV